MCTIIIYIYIYKTEASTDITIFHVSTIEYLKNNIHIYIYIILFKKKKILTLTKKRLL